MEFVEFLKETVSPALCVQTSGKLLENAGFQMLRYQDEWELKQGGKYYINHQDTALFAFTIGSDYKTGDRVKMAAAHTDYPCLRIKPNADFRTNVYAQVNVEVYGGPILNTWMDRPLGIAGRVVTRSTNAFEPKVHLYSSKRPIFIIPNLAIHMNRDVNKGVEINNQIDLMPIVDLVLEEEEQKSTKYFLDFLATELGVSSEDILDFELNTYCVEEPCLVGIKETMLSAPRLDNQTSVYALLEALQKADTAIPGVGINLIALFDHEEIGNTSKQGAGSLLLKDLLERILAGLGANAEEVRRSLYEAMLLSVDVAHATHPNKVGKMDITNQPVMGKGFCIKEASSQSYATDAKAIGIFCQICDKNGVKYQRFANRSDVRGGGTLGSVASTLLFAKAVDIGIPMLAMHSARELMGMDDMKYLTNGVLSFFKEA